MFGLDYEHCFYVKVYRDDGPDFAALHWEAKSICALLWRKVNHETGAIAVGKLGPIAAVAAATGVPIEVVEKHLGTLLAIEALREAPGSIGFPDFVTARDARMSDATRMRKMREAKRVGSVTPRNETPGDGQRRVTETGQGVTPCNAETPQHVGSVTPRNLDQRSEIRSEKREENPPTPPAGGAVAAGVRELGHADPPEPTERGPKAADVRRVFETWQRLHATARARLDAKRDRRIRSRLSEGFSVEDLERALEGAKHDDWLMGRRDESTREYRGLETLLRDAAQVERLLGLWQAREGGGAETPEARAAASRRAALLEAADRANAARRAKAPPPPGRASPAPTPPFPPPTRPLRERLEAEAQAYREENPLALLG